MHTEMLIDGCFVGGPCDQSIGKQVIRSPFDGRIVGTAAEGGWTELRACIDAANHAFQTWRNASKQDRQTLLRRIAELVRERESELAELLCAEVGKPITASLGEVARLAITFDHAAALLEDYGHESLSLESDPRGASYSCVVERFPRGVIFCIVPYNWPFNLAAHKIAPALATANTVIVKPSPLAPLTTMSLVRLIHEAGCPEGVINLWNGPAPVAQKGLADQRIRMLSFTGSAEVGWKLKQLVTDRPVVLELGGDASAIIFDDADLDWATQRIALGAYSYAGQICISIQHVRVQEAVYEEVKLKLIQATLACPFGDPTLPETVCGPLITDEAAEKVEAMLSEAISGGATVLAGGQRQSRMFSPTLVENVPSDCRLAREEVFGPILTLSPFQHLTDAIQAVNASDYGIQTGIFTQSPTIAEMAYRDLEVGGVIINDFPTLRFDCMPYGGVKKSGFGREGVRCSMDEMTEPKTRLTKIS